MSPELGGLSNFFRNATEAQKKQVFEEVAKKATEAQLKTLEEAKHEKVLDHRNPAQTSETPNG